jgi:general secretion pathway protein L
MPTPSSELRLFGLDLPAAWQEIRQAWRNVLRTPALAWLGPRPTVLLREAQGGLGLWQPQGVFVFRRQGEGTEGTRAACHATELPESLVLRKQLMLPALGQEQMAHAVALEAQGSNPFSPSDLVWGHGPAKAAGRPGQVQVELALASRRGVEHHLGSSAGGQPQPEVWVRCSQDAGTAFLLRGFGEAHRLTAERHGWILLGVGAMSALALMAVIAVTPSLQLRERALQAMAQSAKLAEQTRPLVAKREALLAANERAQALGGIIGNRLNPLRTMHTLTNILGDDTVLQRLQIEGRNVLIAGQTPDTAAMMQKLSAQPGFKGVRAPSAATRSPGAAKETFQVEFSIDDETPPAASAPPVQSTSEAKP